MTTSPVRVAVVDDHPLMREGVVAALAARPDFSVVGEGASVTDAIDLCEKFHPDIILLDISMPGNGIVGVRRIASEYPGVCVIMLTASELDDDVMAALGAGARGYILKGIGGQELADIVSSVFAGGSYVSPDLAVRLLKELREPSGSPAVRQGNVIEELTARETQILKLLADGNSNKEIGRALDLQEKTVKHYMTSILQKLQVKNRVEAALKARDIL